MPEPIKQSVTFIDLSSRFQQYNTVDASPALAAETVIATLNVSNFGDMQVVSGIKVTGWAAFTVGTSGNSATLRIRQTGLAGALVVSSGALTVAATNLYAPGCHGFDKGAGAATYVLTLQIGAGAAASTVSALALEAVII